MMTFHDTPNYLERKPASSHAVHEARRGMLEFGFVRLHTPPFLEDGAALHARRPQLLLPAGTRRWCRFPELGQYASWLEDVLTRALPEESPALAALELRHEPPGHLDPEVDRLHADGSYIRCVYTVRGAGTLYRRGKEVLAIPPGQTLVMTAMDRARAMKLPCTLHRRPGPGPERVLIVCSFEPRR